MRGHSVFALKVCLSGSVKLTKNNDSDKHSYSRCGIGFDPRLLFSILNSVKFIIFLEWTISHQCILMTRKMIS